MKKSFGWVLLMLVALAPNPQAVQEGADLTITVDRGDLDGVMTGQTTFQALVADGRASVEGNPAVLAQLMSTMVQFTPDFEMLPGTKQD